MTKAERQQNVLELLKDLSGIEPLKELFWAELNYQRVNQPLSRRGCDIRKYPAIQDHLKQFKKRLMPGVPGGRKPGSYEWYEIQDNIAYWEEFEEPKIVYPDIYEHQAFAWDADGHFLGNTCYFIPADQKWFLALLNSPLIEWFYGNVANRIRGGYLADVETVRSTILNRLSHAGPPTFDPSEVKFALDTIQRFCDHQFR